MFDTASLKFDRLPPDLIKLSKNRRSFLNRYNYYSKDEKRATEEKLLLEQNLDDAYKENTNLYRLRGLGDTIIDYGVIALSAHSVEVNNRPVPCLLIDYLFVSDEHRGDETKGISKLLLDFAIQVAMDVRERVGLRYLILYPQGGRENEKLVNLYTSHNFQFLTHKHEWMFFKLG